MSSNKSDDLKKVGLKVTLPRVKILKLFEQTPARHWSAEELHTYLQGAGDEVGLATIYRVLTQFESAGLIIRHTFSGGHAVFELDPGTHHDHWVCTRCGQVEEFLDEIIEKRQLEIAHEKGFEVTEHSLYLYGICATCQQEV